MLEEQSLKFGTTRTLWEYLVRFFREGHRCPCACDGVADDINGSA